MAFGPGIAATHRTSTAARHVDRSRRETGQRDVTVSFNEDFISDPPFDVSFNVSGTVETAVTVASTPEIHEPGDEQRVREIDEEGADERHDQVRLGCGAIP